MSVLIFREKIKPGKILGIALNVTGCVMAVAGLVILRERITLINAAGLIVVLLSMVIINRGSSKQS